MNLRNVYVNHTVLGNALNISDDFKKANFVIALEVR